MGRTGWPTPPTAVEAYVLCRPPMINSPPLSNPTRKKRMTRDHSQWIFFCCLCRAAPSLQQIYIAFCWCRVVAFFFRLFLVVCRGLLSSSLLCPGMQSFPVPPLLLLQPPSYPKRPRARADRRAISSPPSPNDAAAGAAAISSFVTASYGSGAFAAWGVMYDEQSLR